MQFNSIRSVPKNLLVPGIIFLDENYNENTVIRYFITDSVILSRDHYNKLLKNSERIWYSFKNEIKEMFNEI